MSGEQLYIGFIKKRIEERNNKKAAVIAKPDLAKEDYEIEGDGFQSLTKEQKQSRIERYEAHYQTTLKQYVDKHVTRLSKEKNTKYSELLHIQSSLSRNQYSLDSLRMTVAEIKKITEPHNPLLRFAWLKVLLFKPKTYSDITKLYDNQNNLRQRK